MYRKPHWPFFAPAALTLAALCAACAQPTHVPAKETQMTASVSSAPAIQPYRPHTLEEFPQFTPQEMGQRVLALIDSLKSVDELSLEHIQKVTGFPMERVSQPAMVDYSFTIHFPDSGWYYGLDYRKNKKKFAEFRFGNPSDDHDVYHLPSMTPVCLDYDAYVAALERMGFKKKFDDYDDRGWVALTNYRRANVSVTVSGRREADQPDVKRRHACLESMSFAFVLRSLAKIS